MRRDVVVSGYLESTSLIRHAKRALTRAAGQAVNAARPRSGPSVMRDVIPGARDAGSSFAARSIFEGRHKKCPRHDARIFSHATAQAELSAMFS
jgi:hypothetical protein